MELFVLLGIGLFRTLHKAMTKQIEQLGCSFSTVLAQVLAVLSFFRAPASVQIIIKEFSQFRADLTILDAPFPPSGIGPESWPLNRAHGNQTFLNWYWDQFKNWKPAKYDPDQWVSEWLDVGEQVCGHELARIQVNPGKG